MTARVNIGDQHPLLYKTVIALSTQAEQAAAAAGLAAGFIDLLKIRTSQINGCAFCLRAHTRDALAHGETAERVSQLPAWRESGYFTAVERGALALTESIARIADTHVDDATYAEASAVLTDDQTSAVAWLATSMNSLNRLAVTSRYDVSPD